MRDIETRNDIELLMQEFYKKVMQDEMIGFIFTDVAQLDLKHHLPIITDFWENVLFNTGIYTRNAMTPHFKLNAQVNFQPQHFERWLFIFNETVKENFSGKLADLACTRAKSIASIMQIKLQQTNESKQSNQNP
jgi:hemoglobin